MRTKDIVPDGRYMLKDESIVDVLGTAGEGYWHVREVEHDQVGEAHTSQFSMRVKEAGKDVVRELMEAVGPSWDLDFAVYSEERGGVKVGLFRKSPDRDSH